jgi:phage terminase small subunit
MPPPNLIAAEREAFCEIAACDPRHFALSDLPLLASYAHAVVMEERAARALRESGDVVNGKASPWLTVWEKAHRAMVSLSLRLRLSPQGRARYAKSPPPDTKSTSFYDVMSP